VQDEDEAFFTTLAQAQQPKLWTQKLTPPPLATSSDTQRPPFMPPVQLFHAAATVPTDDGASFFDQVAAEEEVSAAAAGSAPPYGDGVQLASTYPVAAASSHAGSFPAAAAQFATPRRAAAADVEYFAALQEEVNQAAVAAVRAPHSAYGAGTGDASPTPQQHVAHSWATPDRAREAVSQVTSVVASPVAFNHSPVPQEPPLARTLSWSEAAAALPPGGSAVDTQAAPPVPWYQQGAPAPAALLSDAAAGADVDFFESLGATPRGDADAAWATGAAAVQQGIQQDALPAEYLGEQQQQQQAGMGDGEAASVAGVDGGTTAFDGGHSDAAYAVFQPEGAPLPEGWVSGYSPEGYLYYFDTRTGQSQWEPPSEAQAWQGSNVPVVAQEQPADIASDWTSQDGIHHHQQQQQQQWAGSAETYTYAYQQPSDTQQQQPVQSTPWMPQAVDEQQQAQTCPSYETQPYDYNAVYMQQQQQQQQQQLYEMQQAPGHYGHAAMPTHALSAAAASPSQGYSQHGRGPCPTLCLGVDGTLVTAFLAFRGSGCTVAMRSLTSILRAAGPDSPASSFLADAERFAAPAGGVGGVGSALGLSRGASLSDLARSAHDLAGGDAASESQRLLWGILKLMCLHRGVLSGEPAATALLDLLSSAADAPTTGPWPALHAGGTTSAAASAAAAQEAERLLLQGKRAEAVAAALAGGLYGPALLLSRGLGDRAAADVAAACVRGTAAAGSPWHTALCMQAGLDPRPAPGSSIGPGGDAHARYVHHWRANLAALLSSRAPGDGAAMVALGDDVWTATRDCAAAHCCYLLAGVPPQAFGPASRLCLLGSDHRSQPRTYAASSSHVHATELLEAALRAANPQSSVPCLQPYRLLHACALAELGRVREGLAFVDAAAKAVKAGGASVSPSDLNLPVFSACAAAVEDRLRGHLAAKAGVKPGSGAASKLLGGLSTLLDRGISSIFGDVDGAQAPPPGGGPNGTHDAAQQMYPSAQHSVAAVPAGLGAPWPQQNGGQLQPQGPPVVHAATQRRGSSDFSDTAAGAGGSARPSRAVSPATDDQGHASTGDGGNSAAAAAGSSGGLVRSLSSMFGAAGFIRRNKNEAKLGESNKFYFDEKLKMWVEEGKPPPVAAEPPPPPPTSAAAPPPMPMFSSGPPSNVVAGVRSRYVDTFNRSNDSVSAAPRATTAAAVMPPPPASVLPDAMLGLPPRPNRPAFFVPPPQPFVAPPADIGSSFPDVQSSQPVTLNAIVDSPAPPTVGYGELVAPANTGFPLDGSYGTQNSGASQPAAVATQWAEVDL